MPHSALPLTVAELPTLATPAEAASVLRTSTRTIHRLIAHGRLRPAKLASGGSSRLLIHRSAIERLIADMDGVQ